MDCWDRDRRGVLSMKSYGPSNPESGVLALGAMALMTWTPGPASQWTLLPEWLTPELALLLLIGSGLALRSRRTPPTTASLVAIEGTLKGNRFDIEPEGLTIGRDPSVCQVVLGEATVSREHLIILSVGRTLMIKNLSRTNPTYVNGRAIQEAKLKNRDTVKVVDSVFRVELF